jgi:hypothetical protein
MRTTRPLYTLQITIEDGHGSTATRTYVRPEGSRMGRQTFDSFAVGDLLGLVTEGSYVGWSVMSVEEVTA